MSRKLRGMGPATTLTEVGAARFVMAVDKMLAVYTAAMHPAASQLAGRRAIGFPGDAQPRGYSDAEVAGRA